MKKRIKESHIGRMTSIDDRIIIGGMLVHILYVGVELQWPQRLSLLQRHVIVLLQSYTNNRDTSMMPVPAVRNSYFLES
jgi:hypothetical protein